MKFIQSVTLFSLLVLGGALEAAPAIPGSASITYCTAKPSGLGCMATIAGSSPNAPVSGANDWSAVLTQSHPNVPLVFFAGLSGPANLPFLGGTLCVMPPLHRAQDQLKFTAGIAGSCTGSTSLVINSGGFVFDPGPGGTTYIQAWMRDVTVTPFYALSDALQVNMAP